MQYPQSLPASKRKNYIILYELGYINILEPIYKLGGICMYGQLFHIYNKFYSNRSESYNRKKFKTFIDELIKLKVIEVSNLNTNKFIYLKHFGFSLFTGDYKKTPRLNFKSKGTEFYHSILKVEYYLKFNLMMTSHNLNMELLKITRDIYYAKLKFPEINYDIDLLTQIIKDRGPENCLSEIKSLSDSNLLKIIWIDIYNIFNKLRLQNQTVAPKPFYYKLYKPEFKNELFLHYVPEIVIWDNHNNNFYSKKIDNLFFEFNNIKTNYSQDIQKSFRNNGTLGFKYKNHFAYVIKLIGHDERDLAIKKAFIDSHIKNNPNAVLLTNCSYDYIDINRYLNHSSVKNTILNKIDINFDNLLKNKKALLKE